MIAEYKHAFTLLLVGDSNAGRELAFLIFNHRSMGTDSRSRDPRSMNTWAYLAECTPLTVLLVFLLHLIKNRSCPWTTVLHVLCPRTALPSIKYTHTSEILKIITKLFKMETCSLFWQKSADFQFSLFVASSYAIIY